MSNTTLTIRADAPIGTISPRLYGHFAEHLGRCCFRTDVIAALHALPVPMLRWPGGCYADHYHWRDGIGPANERPVRLGMSCGLQVEDDNSLGTHEFLAFCAAIGAEPYLAGNVGSGTPQELCDWLEYCNTAVATTLGRERARNGALAPFGVKLWGVGNENWGCGGNYDAATYACEYVRYATMLRHVDPSAALVVCGFDDTWNVELLSTIGKHAGLVDHLSIHHYWTHGGAEIEFSEAEYYTLLTEAGAAEEFVKRTAAIIQDATGGILMNGRGKCPIGIAKDEWGVWHTEARPWGPGEVSRREPVTYEQAGTLRDALAAAVAMEGFHRQCQVLTLANLAQVVNVLHAPVMTDGARMWLTPTYHALRMHTPHIGATALPVDIAYGDSLPDGSSAVSATASRTDDGVAVTLINRHYQNPASVRLVCAVVPERAAGQLLAADSPRAYNSAGTPDRVAPTVLAIQRDGRDGWLVELPPHSMATVVFRA